MGTLSYLQGMSKREVVPWQSPNIILLIRRTHRTVHGEETKKCSRHKTRNKELSFFAIIRFFRPNNVHKYSIVTEKKNLMKE